MTWVKLDGLFPSHPKVLQAGPSAAWLYVAGLCYCGRYLTDGFVPDAALPGMGQYGVLRARHLAGVLVAANLWERRDGGYYVHDYLKYQPSREEVEGQRARKHWRTCAKRQEVIDRDGMICGLCGGEIDDVQDLHIDHIIPLSRGGTSEMENLQPAHGRCNVQKGARV